MSSQIERTFTYLTLLFNIPPMLKFYHPNRITEFRNNCLFQFMESEAVRLRHQEYDFKYARHILTSISYFGNWLSKNHIQIKKINDEIVARFLKQFKTPTKRRDNAKTIPGKPVIRHAALNVLDYVKKTYPLEQIKTPIQREVYAFYEYLRNERNIAWRTCVRYRNFLDTFLNYFFDGKRIAMRSLTPPMIRDYIEWVPSSLDERTRKDTCSMLNNYFRFLAIKGTDVLDLSVGLPSFQSKYHAPPASILYPEDLKTLLAAIDRTTSIGKRTYASILCQTDLCMRLGDVAKIALNDIDWRNGRIRIGNSKGRKPYWLPLPKRVGEAIADYLKNGRPHSIYHYVFVSHYCRKNHPRQGMHLYYAIKNLWKKAGLGERFFGTRVLRHFGATQMKQKGNSIKVISDILGHTSLQTTAIYAKVDIPALRLIAQEWPREEVSHEN